MLLGRISTAAAPRATASGRGQRGVFLIEALIAILIFSLGILTLVAIQTAAVSAQSDAQYRTEAANYADQILSEIWLNVNRTNIATVQASLAGFQHRPGGGNCNFTGAASGSPLVANWVNAVTGGARPLPGATAVMQQIVVNTGAFNQVSVTVCWKAPVDVTPHRHTVVTFVN